ncbi:MAG: hypothetical protein ABIH46_13975 [Chloroflexota bacterium]
MALVVGLVTPEEKEQIRRAGYILNDDDPATQVLLADLNRCADSTEFVATAVWVDCDVPELLVLD